jgi:hypothetical protein
MACARSAGVQHCPVAVASALSQQRLAAGVLSAVAAGEVLLPQQLDAVDPLSLVMASVLMFALLV